MDNKPKPKIIDTMRKVLGLREKVFGLQEQVSNLNEELSNLKEEVSYLQNKSNLNRFDKELQRAMLSLRDDIEELTSLLNSIGRSYNQSINDSGFSDHIPIQVIDHPISETVTKLDQADLDSSNRYKDIIDTYWSKPTKIKKEKVHPTQKSLVDFMGNVNNGLILGINLDGDFWIIEVNNEQLLFPAHGLRISKHNINYINHFFIGEGFNDKIANRFSVQEPALIEATGTGQWELKRQGKILYGG